MTSGFIIPYYLIFQNNMPSDFDFDLYNKNYNLGFDRKDENFEIKIKNHYCENKLVKKKHPYRLPADFDYNIYTTYNDLKNLTLSESITHYLTRGCQEERIYKLPGDFDYDFYKYFFRETVFENNNEIINHYININNDHIYNVPENFDVEIYKLHNDLAGLSEYDLKVHYLTYGKKEQRLMFKPDDTQILMLEKLLPPMRGLDMKDKYKFMVEHRISDLNVPSNFDLEGYRLINMDVQHMNDIELYKHYLSFGRDEKRGYLIREISNNFNPRNYKLINPDLMALSDLEAVNHYKLHGVFENRLICYPENLNKKFLLGFYYMSDFDVYRKKYIGQIYTIHYEYSLRKYNYYFIYQFYKLDKLWKFDINTFYDFMNQNFSRVVYYNSRTLINRVPKVKKKFQVVYSVYLNSQNINFMGENIENINKTKHIEKLYLVYSTEEGKDYEQYLEGFKIPVVKIKILNKGHDALKYFTGFQYILQSIKDCDKNYFLILNNSINILQPMDEIFDYYYSIENELLSFTDSYQDCVDDEHNYLYHLQSYFFIMNYRVLKLFINYWLRELPGALDLEASKVRDYIIKKVEIGIMKYLWQNNVLGVSFISIDDFLPLFHLTLKDVNLSYCCYLLFRKAPLFLKYVKNEYCEKYVPQFLNLAEKAEYLKNVGNRQYFESNFPKEFFKKIAFCIHIANELMLDDYLLEILRVIRHKYFEFTVFASISPNLIHIQKKVIYFFKNHYVPLKILIVKNHGTDLGPFLKVYRKFLVNQEFDFVIKYHTKTDTIWRREMQYPFEERLYNSVMILNHNPDVGGICSGKFLNKMDYAEKTNFKNIFIRNKLRQEDTKNYYFVGGTIFMIKYSVISNFLNKIDIPQELKNMEETCFVNDEKSDNVSNIHCWERMISSSCYYENTSLFGI